MCLCLTVSSCNSLFHNAEFHNARCISRVQTVLLRKNMLNNFSHSHRTRSCTSLLTLGASASRSSSPAASSDLNRRTVSSRRSDSNVSYPTNDRNSRRWVRLHTVTFNCTVRMFEKFAKELAKT